MFNSPVKGRLAGILQFCILLTLPHLNLFQHAERDSYLESRYWNIIPVTSSHSNLIGFGSFLNQNVSCHRTWNANASKTMQEVKDEASNMTFLNRHQMFSLHMACRKAIPNWKFCIMDKSPFDLRWAFFSVITCKYLKTGETFSVTFDRHKFEDNSRYHLTPSKYLKLANGNGVTKEIMDAANRIERRRDFYAETKAFIAVGVLLRTIAEHMNSTILPLDRQIDMEKGVNEAEEQILFRSPTIHPRIFGRTVTRLDRMALIDSTRYTRIESVDFNFLYCNTPQLLRSQIYDLTIIFQAFKPGVWFLLLISLGMGSLILSKTCYLNDVTSALFTLFSSLLGGNFRFGLESMNKSIFFMGWMLISIILNNYYTGSMTSVLIAPLEERVMTRLAQLYRLDYKFVFPNTAAIVFQLVNVSAFGEENKWGSRFRKENVTVQRWGNTRRRYNQSREIEMLQKMVGTNSKDHSLPITSFTRAVAIGDKKSAFGPWTYVIRIHNLVMEYLKVKNAKLPPDKQISRHCYLGQRLISSGGLFWGFLPPSNEAPSIVFQQFLEGGIYDYWMEEYNGMSYASRVQDRSQVKSPTRILPVDSESKKWSRMGIKDGHTMTILFLWGLGLCLAGMAFTLEQCIWMVKARVGGGQREKMEGDFVLFSRYMR